MKRSTRALVPLAGAVLALGLALVPASGALAGTPAGTACSTAGPNPAPTVNGAPNSGTDTHNAGACDVHGSATIAEVLAFESDAPSFSFPNGSGQPGTGGTDGKQFETPQFAVYIYSNSPSGYYVTDQLTVPFAGAIKPSNILAPTDFTEGADPPATCGHGNGDFSQQVGDDGTGDGLSPAITVASSPCQSRGWDYQNNNPNPPPVVGMPAGYDRFSVLGFSFPTSLLENGGVAGAAAPADTYTGAFTFAAWA